MTIGLILMSSLRAGSGCSGCTKFFRVNTVCGIDGVTYKNECYARCNDSGIAYYGACSSTKQPCGCPDVYNPVVDIQQNIYLNECVANCKGKIAIPYSKF